MSQMIIDRIANVIEQKFGSHIDLSDYEASDHRRRVVFLSRGLAALAISRLANVDDKTAAMSVIDGYGDDGIDAIHFDQKTSTLFFVQSKWSADGKKTIKDVAIISFVEGVNDISQLKFEKFNDKLQKRIPEIKSALYSDSNFCLVTIHTGEQVISSIAKKRADDYVKELNTPVEMAEAIHLNQGEVYKLVTSEQAPAKIDLTIALNSWGFVSKPYLSYYGQVSLLEVSKWWKTHGNAICSRNIRKLLPSSEINDAVRLTVQNEPTHFWYLNNGITMICDSAKKLPAGSGTTTLGVFECHGVSVVNGAQTVGVIGSALWEDDAVPLKPDSPLANAWAQVRIIPLENCPQGFERTITEATNFQNAVSRRDFASMDPVQHRLATEFALDKRRYVYKSGDADPQGEDGCSITEATVALGCAKSMDLAVRAKREISELWADTTGSPYVDIFNDKTTSNGVWRSVIIMRAVDAELKSLRASSYPRAELIGVHLNRAMLHLVFQDPSISGWSGDKIAENMLPKLAKQAIIELFPRISAYIEKERPNDYLGSFAKNGARCGSMARTLTKQPSDPTDAMPYIQTVIQFPSP